MSGEKVKPSTRIPAVGNQCKGINGGGHGTQQIQITVKNVNVHAVSEIKLGEGKGKKSGLERD